MLINSFPKYSSTSSLQPIRPAVEKARVHFTSTSGSNNYESNLSAGAGDFFSSLIPESKTNAQEEVLVAKARFEKIKADPRATDSDKKNAELLWQSQKALSKQSKKIKSMSSSAIKVVATGLGINDALAADLLEHSMNASAVVSGVAPKLVIPSIVGLSSSVIGTFIANIFVDSVSYPDLFSLHTKAIVTDLPVKELYIYHRTGTRYKIKMTDDKLNELRTRYKALKPKVDAQVQKRNYHIQMMQMGQMTPPPSFDNHPAVQESRRIEQMITDCIVAD